MYPQFQATKRFELIEVQIPANSPATRFNIPDQPQLRSDADQDIAIQGIETYSIDAIPFSPNNIAVATPTEVQETFLTLYVDGEESLYRIPMIELNRIANTTAAAVVLPYQWNLFKLKNVYIDWTKSYFFTPVAYGAAGVFTTFSFLLGIHYLKLPPGTMSKIEAKELDLLMNP